MRMRAAGLHMARASDAVALAGGGRGAATCPRMGCVCARFTIRCAVVRLQRRQRQQQQQQQHGWFEVVRLATGMGKWQRKHKAGLSGIGLCWGVTGGIRCECADACV
mmetsp:Transcript_24524/g.78844  ORF Transcript_24524/g.78844 Transcript_24524/m.78844 type:complete len:107 (-) Transcript_24524:436-756(-)